MSISFEEAYGELGTVGYQPIDSLVNLLKSASGEVADASPGSTYLGRFKRKIDMTYVLEKITPEDQEKILSDLESEQLKKLRVIGDRIFIRAGDQNWAIDQKANSYIFIAPTTMEQAINPRFYFFYKSVWYELWVNDLFGNLVHFDSPEPVEIQEREEFRKNLKDALFVFGRYSTGSSDFANSIIAEFKDEA